MRKIATTLAALAFRAGSIEMALAAGSQTVTPVAQAGNGTESGVSMMSDAQIRQQLEAQGYAVQSLKHERDYVEAKVAKGGQPAELKIDPHTGAITADKDEARTTSETSSFIFERGPRGPSLRARRRRSCESRSAEHILVASGRADSRPVEDGLPSKLCPTLNAEG